MTNRLLPRAVLLATAASMAISTLAAGGASAQDYGPPPPPGYDGSQPPPPPPGYQPEQISPQQAEADRRYAEAAQQWAAQYCVKAHGDTAGGAVGGAIVGALLGSAIGGRGNHGAGALVGGVVGAGAGASIADSRGSMATSPGCPPGYVTRGGSPAYYYPGSYNYGAPGWYNPWVYYGDAWVFRPYPYHSWYYGHYGRRHY